MFDLRRTAAGAPKHWLVLLMLWAPIAISFPLAFLLRGGPDAVPQAIWGARAMVIAGALGSAVWWLTGKIRWPERPDPVFYGLHLLGAALFSTLWWGLSVTHGILFGMTTFEEVVATQRNNPWLGWDLMFGGLLFAAIASASYMLRMREVVREERVLSLRSEAELARARLTALQARLNPHFLFNTLHSLSALVRQDQQLAEDALDQFGELMRYSLDNVDRESVSLRAEWKFTTDYIDLEALRMGDRMEVVSDVDPEALSWDVPPFCLQPLVENAIRHGISPLPEGGQIRISISNEEHRLRVSVADNGVGTEVESLTASEGLGLKGVRQRIAGSDEFDGLFQIESSPGSGFVATMTFEECQ